MFLDCLFFLIFCFFNDTATTEISPLSLHDALPIWCRMCFSRSALNQPSSASGSTESRSEEHTSELQSRQYIVCRLLLEKKNHRDTDTPRDDSEGGLVSECCAPPLS